MAYYDALIAKWATLTPGTTAQKLVQLNGLTVIGAAQKAILNPSDILNAIAFADLAALTQLQVSQLTLLLAGSKIDASTGTSIRAGIQALFAGKTATLANLGALVAPFDSPNISWCQANGYPNASGGLGGITAVDLANAGGLT